MNIQEIRQKYPQYNNVDDNTLAQGLHNKYYKDRLSFEDFKGRIGLSQPAQEIKRPVQQQDSIQVPSDPTQDRNPITKKETPAFYEAGGIIDKAGKAIQELPVVGGVATALEDIGLSGAQMIANVAFPSTLGRNMNEYMASREKDLEKRLPEGNQRARLVAQMAAPVPAGKGLVASAAMGSAMMPYTEGGGASEFAQQKLIETGVGAVAGGAVKGIGKAFTSEGVKGKVGELANKAKEFGINLRVDQVKPTRARKTVQKISQDIPFSGVDTQEALQSEQWNKAVASTLGEGIEDLTPESMQKFSKQNSDKYNKVLRNTKINIFPDDIERLNQQVSFIKDNVSPIQYNKINKTIANVLSDLQQGFDDVDFKGVSARKINSLRSDLLSLANKAKGDAKNIIGETADHVHEMLHNSLPPNKKKLLQEANQQYKYFKTIEPLLEKSTNGEINPTRLKDRIASSPYIKSNKLSVGDDKLNDLADIGKQFLPKAGGSDTMPRAALAGIGGASVLSPKTLPIAAGGIGLNRGFQAYNKSKGAVDRALQGVDLNAPQSVVDSVASVTSKGASQTNKNTELNEAREKMIERIRDKISGQGQGVKISTDRKKLIDSIRAKIDKKTSVKPKENSFDNVINDVFEEEGGFVENDAGAGNTNFGINKKANPDIDVKNLTKEKAAKIYKKRYWDKINADNLSQGMQLMAMDAAVNQGVGWTNTALKKAKGDIRTFAKLRKKRYKNIARNPSKKQYLDAWENRVDRKLKKALEYI